MQSGQTAESNQYSLFDGLELTSGSRITLERKPYIQPFEMVLAYAELHGLLGDVKDNQLFKSVADEYVTLSVECDTNQLRRRLAYWQRIENGRLYPTNQVLYEYTDDDSVDKENLDRLDVEKLPLHGRRKLRYGPHDVHEYRGKFFPQLVRSLINAAGLKEGSVVLDPTSGSGTTNVEAKVLGMRSIGADLNPLSVKIARLKSSLVGISPEELSSVVQAITSSLHDRGRASEAPEIRWSKKDLSYLRRWFDEKALEELAGVLQEIQSSHSGVAEEFLLICLSNIVRRVSWQRDSDLRVRKQKERYYEGTVVTLFCEEVQRQASKLEPYLAVIKAERPFPETEIREGDARRIDALFPKWKGKCDVLITSPPYATALPYIDTDRLSLIILGLLPRSEHRDREGDMIGNREIGEPQRLKLWDTYMERRSDLPNSVSGLIDQLAETNHSDEVGFRRRNLPALLSKYFLDMLDAMISARWMMKPDAFAFYVVGNNSTNVSGKRIEIPTDKFLWEIGKKAGWHQEALVDMELLPCRDIFSKNSGSSENILVFRSTVQRTSVYGNFNGSEKENTDTAWNFHDEDTTPHLHALHPFPARFVPQIPRKAIEDYTKPGDTVLDPFCGCGTTLLEAILLNREAIGVDNNAVAELVSKAKTLQYSENHISELNNLLRILEDGNAAEEWRPTLPIYRNRDYWFDGAALRDIGVLRTGIDTLTENPRQLALAVLSSIIVRASHQDSDTRYARVEKRYTPGSALEWYVLKLRRVLEGLDSIRGSPRGKASVHLADGRDLSFLEEGSVDLIVTSPPYLNAYDYHKYHRHRLHWIDGDVSFARDLEIGKHDTFTRPNADPEPYFEDLRICFEHWSRVLKSKGGALIVVGDAIVNGKAVAVADRFTSLFEEVGLSLEDRWLRDLQTTKKSFNQRARLEKEHLLLVRKTE